MLDNSIGNLILTNLAFWIFYSMISSLKFIVDFVSELAWAQVWAGQFGKNTYIQKKHFISEMLDSSMGNWILINLAFWVFNLCPVVQKL